MASQECGSPQIVCEGISVVYENEGGLGMALKDLHLAIHRGEWLAVVGPNGSGKSTLAHVIAGLSPISRGTVHRIDECAVTAAVMQNPDVHILGSTPLEDVLFTLKTRVAVLEEATELAMAVLGKVGLDHDAETPVDQLSGGHKQLLAVASALARNASVLVLDEASSMLDPLSRMRLFSIVRDLWETGMTVVWVTQWLDEAARAERLVVLVAGQIAYLGTPAEFFYGRSGTGNAPCDDLGMVPPYAIQVARELTRRGVTLPLQPLTTETLAQAVYAL